MPITKGMETTSPAKHRFEPQAEHLINQYTPRLYAFLFFILKGDLQCAYETTVSCFMEALSPSPKLMDEEIFLSKACEEAIKKARRLQTSESHFENVTLSAFPESETGLMEETLKSLNELSFEEKALLLLRDQVHLRLEGIALALNLPLSVVRAKLDAARSNLAKKIQKHLRDGVDKNGL